MTISKYSTSILPSPSYKIESNFKTLVSDFDDESEQRNRQWRFPKRSVSLKYNALTQTNRDALHEFYRKQYGSYKPLWFIDFKARAWDDEYVGYAGPYYADIIYSVDGSSYTDQTDKSCDLTVDDVTPVPAVPSANDAFYIGSNSQFTRATIYMSTVKASTVGWVGVWEYPYTTGGTWGSITLTTDQTNGFLPDAAGTKDVDFPAPSSWKDLEVNGVNGYYIRFRISSSSSAGIQPKASQVTLNSLTMDVPAILTSTSDLVIYENGTSTMAYTVSSSGGGGGSYRITFTDYPASVSLITADFTGNLRLKARLKDDTFLEEQPHPNLYNVAINIFEVNPGEKPLVDLPA